MPQKLYAFKKSTANSCVFLQFYFICTLLLLLSAKHALADQVLATNAIIEYQFRIVESFPHSRKVFTQGLEYHNDLLYESAGLRGQSSIFIRKLDSLAPTRRRHLESSLFAEGITLLNGKLYQLTWQSGRVLTYDMDTLEPLGEFTLQGEGWGLTNNAKQLIASNGSHHLLFIDPNTATVTKKLNVTFNGKPLAKLNELEWINGVIYANIWQSNWVVIIEPSNGKVIGKVNLTNLLPNVLRTASTDVLNGIAYDQKKSRLLITGKNWPKLYHIELTTDSRKNAGNTAP